MSLTEQKYRHGAANSENRDVSDKLREVVSVLDFGADNTGTTDSTTAIANALSAIDQPDFEEKALYFPAGIYKVSKIDVTDTTGICFISGGTVQIVGIDDSAGFIFGSTNYVEAPNSALSTVTRRFKMIGGDWLIGPDTGQLYTYGMRLEHFVSGKFENVYVSGDFGPVAGADRISTYLQYSYVNTFNNCSFSSPGVPGATYYSYGLCLGNNNNNLNVFENCRGVGVSGAPTTANTVVASIRGSANTVRNCDFSAAYVGIDISGSSGGVFQNNYHEFCTNIIATGIGAGSSKGNTFIGGLYEVITGGSAFVLGAGSGSQNTTIISPKVKGVSGGSSRTFISHGTTAYGVTVLNPDLENIDTANSGTYLAATGGLTESRMVQAAWLSFPPTQSASSNANTLDDYEEGTWTPANKNGLAFSAAAGKYVKIGTNVTLTFSVTFAVETNAANAVISGVPFSIATNSEQNGLSLGYNTSSTNLGGTITTTEINLRKVGAGGGNASITNMSGALLSGSISYIIPA